LGKLKRENLIEQKKIFKMASGEQRRFHIFNAEDVQNFSVWKSRIISGLKMRKLDYCLLNSPDQEEYHEVPEGETAAN
jgi:hypothetical protein